MRLIDGDALKAKFCNHCDERDCKPDATDTVYGCVIADTIDNMPTIEAEPVKHGRWMYPFYCSECGFAPYYSSDLTYNYCPNCGARMVLKEDKDNGKDQA